MIDSQQIVENERKTSKSGAVEVVNVTKKFGENLAANNISLTIEEGEFFSFLGPSGCGKTTLLRMIAGFENPTEGKILIAGADMKGVPPHKRSVNMVFQNYALFPHLSLGENVAFGLKSTGQCTRAEISERVRTALGLVRLDSMIDRLPSQISGGQQQRAALARAVVNRPSVLLLDEPLSALDPQIREEMQIELSRLQKQLGMTFIMVTHDQNEALALSDRIAVFNQGNLEQVATPENIYNAPGTLFVAKFVGQTNVLVGKFIEYVGQTCRVEVCEAVSIYAKKTADSIAPGAPVAVLVKPHAIRFISTADGDFGDENNLPVFILNKSFQGTVTEYLVSLNGSSLLRLLVPNDQSSSVMPSDASARILIPANACDVLPL